MGFFSKMISATIKTALTPVAVLKDVVNVVVDKDVDSTEKIIDNIANDLSDASDELLDGNL